MLLKLVRSHGPLFGAVLSISTSQEADDPKSIHVCLALPSYGLYTVKTADLYPNAQTTIIGPSLPRVSIGGLPSMTTTSWKHVDGSKNVRWTNSVHFVQTRVSRPYAPQPSSPIADEADTDQRCLDHSEPSAEPSIYTLDIDDPWAKKSILSLDGGGVRGFSSLFILRELMRAVGECERQMNPKATSSAYSPLVDCLPDEGSTILAGDGRPVFGYLPCHYFDYVSGTSTGGLIAILLGRLRMNVDEAIKEYKRLSTKVFGKSASSWRRILPNHDNTERREVLKDKFDFLPPTRLPSPQEQADQFKSDRTRCRTIVCSTKSNENKNFQTPFLFRSYDRKTSYTSQASLGRNPGDRNTFAIWQVARATSAAPPYFKSINMFEARYSDAATNMNLNNPSWEVVREVSLLAKESHDAIDLLLSIGSGNTKGKNSRLRFGTGSLEQELTDISDLVQDKVRSESEVQGFEYFRLDVKEGLQEIRMNEWRPKSDGDITLEKIEVATKRYLEQKGVGSLIQQCARSLVDKRIQRAQTMRWEHFATGVQYRCPLADDCPTPKAKFNTRNDLMDHLRTKHNQAPPDADHHEQIQKLLNQGRTNSE